MPEHPVAKRRRVIHDLKAVIGWRSLLEVLQAHPMPVPMVSSQKNLAVIAARIARRFNNQKAELPRIGASVEVRLGHSVAVIPARASRFRREAIDERLPLWNDGRSLLG